MSSSKTNILFIVAYGDSTPNTKQGWILRHTNISGSETAVENLYIAELED